MVILNRNRTRRFELDSFDCDNPCVQIIVKRKTLYSCVQEEHAEVGESNEVAKYLRASLTPSPNISDENAETGAVDNIIEKKSSSENQTKTNKVDESDPTGSVLDGHQNSDTTNVVDRAVTPPPDDTIPVSSDALPSSSPDVSSVCLYCLALPLRLSLFDITATHKQLIYTPGRTQLTKTSLERLQYKFRDGMTPSKFDLHEIYAFPCESIC